MSDPLVDPSDLGTYLGIADIATDRAALLLQLAQQLCEAVIYPLPDGAAAVILDVAGRAWSNPTNITSQAVGPFPVSYGTVSGGLWLTAANKSTLRHLAGNGGAFTIDTMPATAGQGLPWWDAGLPISADDVGWSGGSW